MNQSSILSYLKSNLKEFQEVKYLLAETADKIRYAWNKNTDGVGLGTQYLANGTIKINPKSDFEFEITYEQSRGEMNYVDIAENGDEPYGFVQGLLNSSKKVRVSKNGIRYLLVPLSDKDKSESSISQFMNIKSSKGDSAIPKNSYEKISGQNSSNTAGFRQQNGKGGNLSSSKNLVIITDKSNWNFYPKIQGENFTTKMQKLADEKIKSSDFQKKLTDAILNDMQRILKNKFPEFNSKNS